MRRIYLHIAVAAALAIAWGLPGIAQATFPGKNGKLSGTSGFRSTDSATGHEELYTINPDGTGETLLAAEHSPQTLCHLWCAGVGYWSPDGQRIAFNNNFNVGLSTRPTASTSIDLINADGTDHRTLVPWQDGSSAGQTWSPDGQEIAFLKQVAPYTQAVSVARADGRRKATDTPVPTGGRVLERRRA
jgi:Tol biopolymer transport system component